MALINTKCHFGIMDTIDKMSFKELAEAAKG
jgi:hypothetical protein